MVNMGWAAEEFKTIDLGDKRLDKRAVLLAERLAEKPTASIPGACGGWAETQAAYRFLAQDAVGWEDILRSHGRCSAARMGAHRTVLCLQDTTELDFNGQTIAGLGPLSFEAQRGLYVHPTYAVSVEREPLGVLDAWMWAREPKDARGARPGPKESQRWVEGYERIAELAAELPHTRLVYVADRESDIMELMARARDLGHPADWLLRSQHNRNLPGGVKLWNTVSAAAPMGEIRFTMPSRHGQKARPVRQDLWAQRVQLPDGKGGKVAATCIIAREKGAARRPQAGAVAAADQPRGGQLRGGGGVDRLVSGTLGNRVVLPRAEERLPGGSFAALEHRAAGTGVGAVHGGGLAHRPADAAGAHLPGPGSGIVVRPRRMASGVYPDEEAPSEEAAPPQRGRPPDRYARRISRPQGRRRAGGQDHLAGPPARRGFRAGTQLGTSQSCGLSCV